MTSTSSPLLRVSGLSIGYRSNGTLRQVVSDASFHINRGETIALVGESGSGKSSLAHALIGLLPANGRLLSGSIEFAETELAAAKERTWRRIRGARIGLVPQDPGVSLNPTRTIGAQIAEALRVHGRANARDAGLKAIELLETVGIDQPAQRARQYPHELSGGMRQRVLIAIAVACTPDLVIADEATSALDVTVQRRILDLLTGLTRGAGVSALLVTHDLGIASDRADRILVMSHGRIVEQGPVRDILRSPQTPDTRTLVASMPSMSSRRLTPRSTIATTEATPVDRPLLSLRSIRKQFLVRGVDGRQRQIPAVAGISLEIAPRSTLAVVGESGSGKTTLARIAARLETADEGQVYFEGCDITDLGGERLRRMRAHIQVVYQNPYASLSPRLDVADIIAEPLRAFGATRHDQQSRVDWLLDQVSLPASVKERKARELSGGQRQRVAIARAIALNPKLLILDEPVSALDVSVQGQILQLLVDLQAELGLGYLFITHDLAVVRQIADQILVMRAGAVVESGPADDVLLAPRQDYTRELLLAIAGRVGAAA